MDSRPHDRPDHRRRVVAQQWISVDGFAAGPTGEGEIFAHVPAESDRRSMAINETLLGEVETVLLGRRTYEVFVAFWPTEHSRDVPVAPLVNAVPKLVASTTLAAAPWGDHAAAEVVSDAVAHVRDLRAGPGGLVLVWGSLALMRSLLAAGLVDELDLFVAPVALGGGTPLIAPGRPVGLRQIAGEVFPAGGAHLRFAVAG
ncbi:dihydrofolate reductase family protein [Actinomycetospora straminea]|uniref:Dihydrofolate reductase family protein n=1 Tax=Actinomycetospora straminea TaxID=663607 RepID=A0ABP9E179_9PSEU|nr:dihydrofolate reductase family protein [Actinomycetospora straminea]MDD7934123.1 dihydrofolate reductase family protein [Actinomycetospora straminea]